MNTQSPPVSERHREDFQRDGVVLIRNLLDDKWRQILAEGVEYNLAHPTARTTEYVRNPANTDRFFFDAVIHGQFPAYDRYMLESPLAETVAQIMNTSLSILFYMTVFVRSPGTGTRTPWHQDQPSWSAVGNHACSVWTSLDPVPLGTGLEFVRGSHRWEEKYQRPPFFHRKYEKDDHGLLPSFPDIEAHRDELDIVSFEMEPGDCLVFHGMTAHGGSGDLPPGLGRRAFSVQWLGDDARLRETNGLDDPDISKDVKLHGVKPGESPVCDICPVVWQR